MMTIAIIAATGIKNNFYTSQREWITILGMHNPFSFWTTIRNNLTLHSNPPAETIELSF